VLLRGILVPNKEEAIGWRQLYNEELNYKHFSSTLNGIRPAQIS
jgi:hypothetical protein